MLEILVPLHGFSRSDPSASLSDRGAFDALLPAFDSLHLGFLTSPRSARMIDSATTLFSKTWLISLC